MEDTTEAAAIEAGTADEAVTTDPKAAAEAEPQEGQDTEATDTEGDESQTAEIEEIELSFGARTLKVPKDAIPEDVRAALDDFTKNVNGDYTRKTQDLAEKAKLAETQIEFASKLASLKGDALAEYAAGQAKAREIQQLEEYLAQNHATLWQSNPDQARQLSDAISAKRAEFAKHVENVSRYEAQAAEAEQRATAALMEAGRARVAEAIKGFDAAKEAELIDYAVKTYGIDEQKAKLWALNPEGTVMAWKAMQFDKLQAQTKAATAAKPAAPPAAPVKAISSARAPVSKDPDKMSDAEWLEWRNKQLARQRA